MPIAIFLLACCTLRPELIEGRGDTIEAAKYKGRDAIHMVESGGEGVGIIKDSNFHNGTIELDIAAMPKKGASEGARGFAGIAFRVQSHNTYEAFYLRPTNGRADDQLRRNHSTQYISEPKWPWQKLRQEMPGVYESYVDLVPGEWTHVKVVVHGTAAELYVNGATQPCLIVKDLKAGDTKGPVALWLGSEAEAYYANLVITPSEQ